MKNDQLTNTLPLSEELDNNFYDIDLSDNQSEAEINQEVICENCQINTVPIYSQNFGTYFQAVCENCFNQQTQSGSSTAVSSPHRNSISSLNESAYSFSQSQVSYDENIPLTTNQELSFTLWTLNNNLISFAEQTKKENEAFREEIRSKLEPKKEPKTNSQIANWLLVIATIGTIVYSIHQYFFPKKKIVKETSEIKDEFNQWIKNIYSSLWFYVLFYFLSKKIIDSYIEPKMVDWLKVNENLTILITAGILGLLFIVDGYITSLLKTPLQSLSINIKNSSNLSKDKKSHLLSKTQESNELFKETFKRFGIMIVPSLLGKMLGPKTETLLYSTCFLYPVLLASYHNWKLNSEISQEC